MSDTQQTTPRVKLPTQDVILRIRSKGDTFGFAQVHTLEGVVDVYIPRSVMARCAAVLDEGEWYYAAIVNNPNISGRDKTPFMAVKIDPNKVPTDDEIDIDYDLR